MLVNVQYDKYNTVMTKAEIPLEENSSISLELTDEIVTVGDEEESDVTVKKLILKGTDNVTGTNIELAMDKLEAREFMVLLSKFQSSMG